MKPKAQLDLSAVLRDRAIAHYKGRLDKGETVTVYTWQRRSGSLWWGTQLVAEMRMVAAQYGTDKVRLVELDPKAPGSAFGPAHMEQSEYATGLSGYSATRAYHTDYSNAVAWVDKQRLIDPAGVARGDYYIDSLTEDL